MENRVRQLSNSLIEYYEIPLEYIKKIKPKTVVPMHYHIKNSTVDIKPVQSFTSLLGEYKTVKSPYRYGGETGVVVIASEQGESV